MRQYTTPEQTAKLIELGFEKPKSATTISWDMPEDDSPFINANSIEFEYQYSIGELIEMLPPHIGRWELDIFHDWHFERWVVCIDPENYTTAATELIDALYNMITKLKEEGVI